MKKIIVASLNPVKIDAVIVGFSKMFPGETFDVQGVPVSSGVSNQPMSEIETQTGVNNRVESASRLVPDADYWVGIEGGNAETLNGMEAFAWVLVKSKEGKYGKGRSTTFFLPQKLTDLVKQGIELGTASDMVFKEENSKQHNGTIGILTANVMTRADYCEQAVIIALIPFKNPNLF